MQIRPFDKALLHKTLNAQRQNKVYPKHDTIGAHLSFAHRLICFEPFGKTIERTGGRYIGGSMSHIGTIRIASAHKISPKKRAAIVFRPPQRQCTQPANRRLCAETRIFSDPPGNNNMFRADKQRHLPIPKQPN